MKVKLLEVRDEGTFIPMFCVDMNPGPLEPLDRLLDGAELKASFAARDSRLYLLRRCGYPCDGRPNIAITPLDAGGGPMWNDPYAWDSRTFAVAHKYINDHWAELRDGGVVDVEFILGERLTPKASERETASI
jgi:hypothetical protein